MTEGEYRFRVGLLPRWLLQWIRYEEQSQKYLKDILNQTGQKMDRWAGGEGEIIEITSEDMRQHGYHSI